MLKLKRFGIKIIAVFVPQSRAVDLLCTAYINGFKWTDYSWIFTDIGKPEMFNSYCQADTINNAIFLQLTQCTMNTKSCGFNHSSYYETYHKQLEKSSVEVNISIQSNPYANVLYDSIGQLHLLSTDHSVY